MLRDRDTAMDWETVGDGLCECVGVGGGVIVAECEFVTNCERVGVGGGVTVRDKVRVLGMVKEKLWVGESRAVAVFVFGGDFDNVRVNDELGE